MSGISKEVCAIILAAGESKRFGAENKLLVELDGVAVLERVVRSIVFSGVKRVVVVTGADHEMIVSLLDGYVVDCIQNPDWKQGMGRSLAFGVEQVRPGLMDGLLVCLGDLPYLDGGTVTTTLLRFCQAEENSIVIPVYKGRQGHPIVFSACYTNLLTTLEGDEGARSIIAQNETELIRLDVETNGIYRDMDFPEDLNPFV